MELWSSLRITQTIARRPGFTELTGYQPSEILGRNCRFLQGEGTDPAAVAKLGAAVREHRTATVRLLNYKKDGTSFMNQVRRPRPATGGEPRRGRAKDFAG
jgi:PAS domain-containing protein